MTDTPILKNRFRVHFYKCPEDSIIDKLKGISSSNLLSTELISFSHNAITGYFEFGFRYPTSRTKEFDNDILQVVSFGVVILDNNGGIESEKMFEVEQLTDIISEYSYRENDPVTIIVKGIYK